MAALNDEVITIYGDGGQLRDFFYIDDVVKAMMVAASHNNCRGEVFNVSAGRVVS